MPRSSSSGLVRCAHRLKVTESMKTMRLDDSQELPALVEAKVDLPEPGSGELLVQVYGAGVIPTELLWYPTTHPKSGSKRLGAVPGHEFSGVLAALGEGVTGIEVGQEVYGMNDWFADGATAEYCLTRPGWVALKPRGVTH